MGPTSQAHFDSQEQFEAELSTLAESYRAWSASEPEDVIVTPVESGDDETLAVVTLVGIMDDRRQPAAPGRRLPGPARRR